MKEIFRSFEGKLNCDNQSGYIIYESEKFYQIEFLSVWNDVEDGKIRIWKEYLSEKDFGNIEKINNIQMDIENGCFNYGQCFYKQRWFGFNTICKIQDKNQSNEWKKFVY